ncbi:MAG: thioredoxin domain-containing protein [Candidatus Hydrogenedentota bacterium]
MIRVIDGMVRPIIRTVPGVLLVAVLSFVNLSCAQDAEPKPTSNKEPTPVATPTEVHKHTNRLVNETSPYLLQHAHNPVDWYPWGDEALEKAKAENKPIFLSVGYSSCHWCHVMEHESFEDDEVAALLNEHFISIKVDREERPDIDEIYMAAVQAMTGQGGWPMSVFITPELKPFWGGTYFPKESKFGRPGFMTILAGIADSWDTKHEQILESSEKLTTHMNAILASDIGGEGEPTPQLITNAVAQLASNFDRYEGGFGQAPKFPSSSSIAMVLREYNRTKDADLLHMATLTLDKMSDGGMYDHLGGGFARYSTDDEWLVPHFEKMLYDNAQLAQVYLEAYQLTGNEDYRRVVDETFTYILRDMRDERGGFHSAEDADSEGEEGKFYIWDRTELDGYLGKADAKLFCTYYNVKADGNFSSQESYHEGLNILHTPISDEAVAKILQISEADLSEKMAELKAKLLEVRSKRVRPGLDDKVLTSWNALMISAFAQGYQVLGDEAYRDAAVEAADFILNDMIEDGELLRTHRKGTSRIPAYLDDYAFMIVALLDVYEATFDTRWIQAAQELAIGMTEKFWDEEVGQFYFTSLEHKHLIVRTSTSQDNATPSGNSMAAYGLLRLAKFTDSAEDYDMASRIIMNNYPYLNEHPLGFMRLMCAVDFMVYPPREIALAGPLADAGTTKLLVTVRGNFIPNKIVAQVDPADASAVETAAIIPLLANKTMINNKATAYVCKDFACKKPVDTPEALAKQLDLNPGE